MHGKAAQTTLLTSTSGGSDSHFRIVVSLVKSFWTRPQLLSFCAIEAFNAR